MEDTKKQIFEVLVSGDDSWQVFKIGGELLNADLVPRLDIIPTPDKFVEDLLLGLFVCDDLWMTNSIVYFTQLLNSNFRSNNFSHSIISILNWLYSILVQLASEILHEVLIGNFVAVGFEIIANVSNLFLSEVEFPALKSPPEVSFLEHSGALFV